MILRKCKQGFNRFCRKDKLAAKQDKTDRRMIKTRIYLNLIQKTIILEPENMRKHACHQDEQSVHESGDPIDFDRHYSDPRMCECKSRVSVRSTAARDDVSMSAFVLTSPGERFMALDEV